MKLLFFDTETNGLPITRNAPETQVDNWPRVVSIAWRLYDWTAGSILSEQHAIVKPLQEMVWSKESAAIHGISKERAFTEGRPILELLTEFKEVASMADAIIAHNMAFDRPVLQCEFRRAGLSLEDWPLREFCTMDSTKGLCKLPTRYGRPSDPYKYPKLVELHTFLFGNKGEYAFHSALDDVRCLVRCFEELCFRRVVPLDDWIT